jgi:hypothetical protein
MSEPNFPSIEPCVSPAGFAAPGMRRFLGSLALFVSPFVLFTAGFCILDPYKILWSYTDYSDAPVQLNRDYISTENYIAHRRLYHYDSFMFGTSRTSGIRIADWRPYLGTNASPFKFDASGETLFGIWKKVQYIDRQGDHLRNALILICTDSTLQGTNDSRGYLFIKHPALVGGGWGNLYLSSLRAWASDGFFIRYLDYRIFGHFRPYMKGYVETWGIHFDPVTNDLFADKPDAELARDEEGYYRQRQKMFYTRPAISGETPAFIGPVQRQMLEDMHRIFVAQKTDYRIAISPLYNQIALNRKDLEALREIFGASTVSDFSGVNSMTANPRNYYETSHFRLNVGKQMLQEIYAPENHDPYPFRSRQ